MGDGNLRHDLGEVLKSRFDLSDLYPVDAIADSEAAEKGAEAGRTVYHGAIDSLTFFPRKDGVSFDSGTELGRALASFEDGSRADFSQIACALERFGIRVELATEIVPPDGEDSLPDDYVPTRFDRTVVRGVRLFCGDDVRKVLGLPAVRYFDI